MRQMELDDEAPGRLIPAGARSYYRPDPLPPDRGLDLSNEFYETLSEATYQLGRLNGISPEVDVNAVLYTTLIRMEAVESTEIEGAQVSLDELFHIETRQVDLDEDVRKDIHEVLNYERAVKRGVDEIKQGGGISIDLVRTLHRILLQNVRSETDTLGEFRNHPVHLPSPRGNKPPFVPPGAGGIEPLMENLISFSEMSRKNDRNPLIDLGLIHYQFESIHPFGDGNGRLGRLLITLQLIDRGLLSDPYLYLSGYFNRYKVEYVERMRGVSERGEWEAWLEFFVEGIRNQSREAYERSMELIELRRTYHDRFDRTSSADRLARKLFEMPYFTASDIVSKFDVSRQTAYNWIDDLESRGIVEEVTERDWRREYKASEVFEILERPPKY